MLRNIKKIDYLLLIFVLLLVFFGIIMVYSTTFYTQLSSHQSAEDVLNSGLLYACIGTLVMTLLAVFDYRKINNKYLMFALFIIVILLNLYAAFRGTTVRGANRYIDIGSIRITPSELSKSALVFMMASAIHSVGDNVKKFGNFVFLFLMLVCIIVPTLLQKSLSASVGIGVIGLAVMFIAGTRVRYILPVIPLALAVIKLYTIFKGYASTRIVTYKAVVFDRAYNITDQSYQIMQSIYAIGTGGLLGKGIGKSEFKLLRLPDAHTDFIFSIIAEELGYVFSLVLLLTYIFIIGRIFKIAIESKDTFGFIVASGIGTIVAVHVLINVGVAICTLPTTGMTLPFISKGGTSLIIMMSLIGIVLNISYRNNVSEG